MVEEGTDSGKQALESQGCRDDVRSSFFSFDALRPNCSLSALHLAAMEKLRQSLLGCGIYSVLGRRVWLALAGLTLVSIHALQQVPASALPRSALYTLLRILQTDLATFSYQSHGSFPHIENQSKTTHKVKRES